MRYNTFPQNEHSGFMARKVSGAGHHSRGMGTKFCCQCAENKPSKGGKMNGPMFICALHQPEVPVCRRRVKVAR